MSTQAVANANDALADLLANLHIKGVRLWAEGDTLHYKAAKGCLTEADIRTLKGAKDQILLMLANAEHSGRPEGKPLFNRAPFTFSQASYWELLSLGERRTIRQIASATRLIGKLSRETLKRAISALLTRHESLRTRVAVSGGIPYQQIDAPEPNALVVRDLSHIETDLRESAIRSRIDAVILARVDVCSDPLYSFELVALDAEEHVLIVALEHLISDAFSMNILLRDLFQIYEQITSGTPVSLPVVAVQFPDYAVWQRTALSAWRAQHERYWCEHLAGAHSVRFPVNSQLPKSPEPGWGHVSLQLERHFLDELRKWSSAHKTTAVLAVFAAYAALVMRWCRVWDMVLQWQSDGRADPKLENTIGYFATVIYLRIRLAESDTFLDLLDKVNREYCDAYKHTDLSHLSAQRVRSEFVRDGMFNWIPMFEAKRRTFGALTIESVSFDNPAIRSFEFDRDPVVLIFEGEAQVRAEVCFPNDKFASQEIKQFSANLLVYLETLTTSPTAKVSTLPLFGGSA